MLFPKHNVENVASALRIEFCPVINLSNRSIWIYRFNDKNYEMSELLKNPKKYYLINVPKFKNHPIFPFSCAVKNIYGCFPNPDKLTLYHADQDICESITAICSFLKPDFTLVDAVHCQDHVHDLLRYEDKGYFYDYGYLFCGKDPLAIDRMFEYLIGSSEDCLSGS
jgi:uncharacterized protein (DUF362 family)